MLHHGKQDTLTYGQVVKGDEVEIVFRAKRKITELDTGGWQKRVSHGLVADY